MKFIYQAFDILKIDILCKKVLIFCIRDEINIISHLNLPTQIPSSSWYLNDIKFSAQTQLFFQFPI